MSGLTNDDRHDYARRCRVPRITGEGGIVEAGAGWRPLLCERDLGAPSVYIVVSMRVDIGGAAHLKTPYGKAHLSEENRKLVIYVVSVREPGLQGERVGLSDCSREQVSKILHDERRELVFAQFVYLFARSLAAQNTDKIASHVVRHRPVGVQSVADDDYLT